MTTAFTEYLLSLDDSGRPPNTESFDVLLGHLRRHLVREMRRKNLWLAPPSYLGIPHPSWTSDALEELTTDLYVFIFVERRESLLGLLESHLRNVEGGGVEGAVIRNIRHFLFERQRQADPIGYRVFNRLSEALRNLVRMEILFIVAGDTRIRNSTLLRFCGETSLRDPAAPEFLEVRARAWNDDLLPELLSAQGKAVSEVIDNLIEMILTLRQEGVATFRFGDLIKPLKSDAEQRWRAFLSTQAQQSCAPDESFVEQESYLRLIEEIEISIHRLKAQKRTRAHLSRLWLHLGTLAERDDPSRLTKTHLAQSLDIPRERIPDLMATLAGLVENHHASGAV